MIDDIRAKIEAHATETSQLGAQECVRMYLSALNDYKSKLTSTKGNIEPFDFSHKHEPLFTESDKIKEICRSVDDMYKELQNYIRFTGAVLKIFHGATKTRIKTGVNKNRFEKLANSRNHISSAPDYAEMLIKEASIAESV